MMMNSGVRHGANAYRKGSPITSNPHAFGTVDFEAWNFGWNETMVHEHKMTPESDGKKRYGK